MDKCLTIFDKRPSVEVYVDTRLKTLLTLFLYVLGLKNPYLVLMDGDIERCKKDAAAIGFDAISSYGIGGGGTLQVNILGLFKV